MEKKQPFHEEAERMTQQQVFVPEKYTAMTAYKLTPEEIREGNRIVAEYMGATFDERISGKVYCDYPNGVEHTTLSDFYFGHWEKMIPVWAKVAKDLRELSRTSACGYFPEYAHYFSTATEHDNKPSAFRALVAAIKLLNEKTK